MKTKTKETAAPETAVVKTKKVAKPSEASGETAFAKIKAIKTSPRKLNLVAGLIRGLHVQEAMTQLTFSKKRVANPVKTCLNSAIANAENNLNLDIDSLYVHRVLVGKSFVMKRSMPRARGRAASIKKPFSALTIILEERKK